VSERSKEPVNKQKETQGELKVKAVKVPKEARKTFKERNLQINMADIFFAFHLTSLLQLSAAGTNLQTRTLLQNASVASSVRAVRRYFLGQLLKKCLRTCCAHHTELAVHLHYSPQYSETR
jgi:hypothetical protein